MIKVEVWQVGEPLKITVFACFFNGVFKKYPNKSGIGKNY